MGNVRGWAMDLGSVEVAPGRTRILARFQITLSFFLGVSNLTSG